VSNPQKLLAEFLGTFWLVSIGCGAAIFANLFLIPSAGVSVGIGLLGVSLAFGLAYISIGYAIGHISGCHLNPAVTVGLTVGGKFSAVEMVGYIAVQVCGAIAAAWLLHLINFNREGFLPIDAVVPAAFSTNGYDTLSPSSFNVFACFLAEAVFTAFFVLIFLGASDERAPKGFAPLAIGLALAVIYMMTMPITNGSINPARSTGPALFVGTQQVMQLWLFWVAPLLGAVFGGIIYRLLQPTKSASK
jgi:aquaporin Z